MKLKIFSILTFLFCCTAMWAVSDEELMRLHADMLRSFGSQDREAFIHASNRLKESSQDAGDDKLFYEAWSYQSIFEATCQDYQLATDIAQRIRQYARSDGSTYGEYMALHTEAVILLHEQEFEEAEQAFQKAVEFHHRHFTNESVAADLLELMMIADRLNDEAAGVHYAKQMLQEPNLSPTHRGRALYRLSQTAFDNSDIAEFNRLYDALTLLKEVEEIKALMPLLEVDHAIINRDYFLALSLADSLDVGNSMERKAVIYHLMGNDRKAYEYMQQYKRASDSILIASHRLLVSTYFEQMNNERLQLDQQLLERKNNQLRNYVYMAFAALAILVLLIIIWRGARKIRSLRSDNKQLVFDRKDAERALSELNELSFYESQTALALTSRLNPDHLCDRLADSTQNRCHKGVAVIFQSRLPENLEIKTDPDALRKLLLHLLNYAARFTNKGSIKLCCATAGDNIRFSVTDTSEGLYGEGEAHHVGMFADQGRKVRYVGMNFNICQSITRLLHGRIWHDTEYTNGTRFCFEVPINPQTTEASVVRPREKC